LLLRTRSDCSRRSQAQSPAWRPTDGATAVSECPAPHHGREPWQQAWHDGRPTLEDRLTRCRVFEHVAHMRTNLLISVTAHVALLAWYVVSVADPKPFDAVAVEPMTVDLVPADQVDRSANLSPPPAIETPEFRPTPDQERGPHAKPSFKTASAPTNPPQGRRLESKSQGPSNAPQVGELVVGPRITEPVQYSPPADLAEAQSIGFDSPSESGANLLAQELTAFKLQVQKCWNAPTGVANTEKLHVVLRLALARDGTLTTRPLLIEGSASPHGPALVESAISALRQCQPYRLLPADRYEEWKVLDLTFSPNGVSGG